MLESAPAASFKTPAPPDPEDTNPLRMLRSGVPVRPKVRGNKHNILVGNQTVERSHNVATSRLSSPGNVGGSLPRRPGPTRVPPPTLPRTVRSTPTTNGIDHTNSDCTDSNSTLNSDPTQSDDAKSIDQNDFLPIPPRSSKPTLVEKPRHQRKHPLNLPGNSVTQNTISHIYSNHTEVKNGKFR